MGLGTLLPQNELVECDAGPGRDSRLMTPNVGTSSTARKEKSKSRARQETVFPRLKQFNVLDTHFHHGGYNNEAMMRKHQICFDAVLVITQLKLMLGVDTFFESPKMDGVSYTMP